MIRCKTLAALAMIGIVSAFQASALELKFSHVLPTNEAMHEVLLEFAEALQERSNGYFVVNVYANSELGNNKDNLEMIRRGANIVACCDCGFLADYVPAYGSMNGPFLYNDWQEIVRLGKSDWHKTMIDECAEKGLRVLSMDWYFGRRHIISDKEITEPADLAGMKIRVPPNKVWIDTVAAMGGSPTVLQWAEVYSALSQGVVDGAEAPLSTFYGSKLQEVKKRISETKHFTAMIGFIMSERIWQSMPEEYQTMLQDAINEYGLKCSILTAQREDEWKKRLEDEGAVFNRVNDAAFAEACKVVYDNPDWPSYDELRRNIDNTPFPYQLPE